MPNLMDDLIMINAMGYPRPEEIIDPNISFRPATLKAVEQYKAEKPWRGTKEERAGKMQGLLDKLVEVYQVPKVMLQIVKAEEDREVSYYNRDSRTIILSDKLSVITLLHEFGHVLGKSERGACRYSVNIFRIVFPRQFAKLHFKGHMLQKGGE